jgi:hypothetical protein
MPRKKQVKKTQKSNRPKGKTIVKDKLHGSDHVVIETKGDPTQEENPLSRMKIPQGFSSKADMKGPDYGEPPNDPTYAKLPKGFKTADKLTEKDDLEFENGKLREMLVSWLDRVFIEGVAYQVMIDPLNRQVSINREYAS